MLEQIVDAVKALTRPVLLLGTAGAAFYFFATGNTEGGTSASTLFGVQAAWWFNERKELHESEQANAADLMNIMKRTDDG